MMARMTFVGMEVVAAWSPVSVWRVWPLLRAGACSLARDKEETGIGAGRFVNVVEK